MGSLYQALTFTRLMLRGKTLGCRGVILLVVIILLGAIVGGITMHLHITTLALIIFLQRFFIIPNSLLFPFHLLTPVVLHLLLFLFILIALHPHPFLLLACSLIFILRIFLMLVFILHLCALVCLAFIMAVCLFCYCMGRAPSY